MGQQESGFWTSLVKAQPVGTAKGRSEASKIHLYDESDGAGARRRGGPRHRALPAALPRRAEMHAPDPCLMFRRPLRPWIGRAILTGCDTCAASAWTKFGASQGPADFLQALFSSCRIRRRRTPS